MQPRDHTRLLAGLAEAYRQHSPRSAQLNERAQLSLIDGGSHSLRLIQPFPPRIVSAHGAYVTDEDGHRILDCWQGHFANILGHNPGVVTQALLQALPEGAGLQTGFADRVQIEAAELLCRQTGAERVRFTTSGTLATMYAIMLARAFTGRELVMKVGGGWHGGQPWGLVGTGFSPRDGFAHADSAGLPEGLVQQVVLTRFNDLEMLETHFRQYGDRIACFITELCPGSGGGMAATMEYVQAARELADRHGALLIFDEVITGFRLRAGDAARFYGVRPDLSAFGKVIGGGMPLAAVAGREEIMRLAGREGGNRVKFSGGTYSGHPATMLAGLTMMSWLAEHGAEIYPRLGQLGDRARALVEGAFKAVGVPVVTTGQANGVLPAGSLVQLHFPYQPGQAVRDPDDAHDPGVCDTVLVAQVLQLALLLEDVHVVHGLGGLSAAHTEEDVEALGAAFCRVAERLRTNLA